MVITDEFMALSESNNDTVNVTIIVVISVTATVGILLLIVIVLVIIITLHRRGKNSKDIIENTVTSKPSPQFNVTNDDQNIQQYTHDTADQSYNYSDNDVSSQGTVICSLSRLDIINELYISAKVPVHPDSLLHIHSRSIPKEVNCDVTMTPNPSYSVSPSPSQTRRNSEQELEYDYIATNDDKLTQHNNVQSVGSTNSNGVYDDIVTDPPAGDDYDYVNI